MKTADFHCELRQVTLKEPFRIAHGTSTHRTLLRISGLGAVGEAPFVPYYAENPEETLAWAQGQDFAAWLGTPPAEVARMLASRNAPRFGRMAVDVLLQDLAARAAGLSLGDYLAAQNPALPPRGPMPAGCRTLSIPDDLAVYQEQVRQTAREFPVLKLKCGSGSVDFDAEIIAKARQAAPHHTLFVDANGAWTVEETLSLLPTLVKSRVQLLEQPVSSKSFEPWRELRAQWPVGGPLLVADESVQSMADIRNLADYVDGVNLKLAKFGSLTHTIDALLFARAQGLRVMIGCMVESAVGVTAAAHLARWADDIDLDGHLLLAEDDHRGACYGPEGQLRLPDGIGLGLKAPK